MKKTAKKSIPQMGGEAVLKKHGREYFVKLAQKSVKARKKLCKTKKMTSVTNAKGPVL